MITLDKFLGDELHVDFIKIDTEGAELAVIAGMQSVLDSNPDLKIHMEWIPKGYRENGYDPEKFMTTMIDRGYNVWRVDFKSEFPVSLTRSEAIALCHRAATNLFFSRSKEDWI
jgi:hypothetical protein